MCVTCQASSHPKAPKLRYFGRETGLEGFGFWGKEEIRLGHTWGDHQIGGGSGGGDCGHDDGDGWGQKHNNEKKWWWQIDHGGWDEEERMASKSLLSV